ncbi:MAG: hypothetical protein WCG75_01585 [Armatimonadota bacterium]
MIIETFVSILALTQDKLPNPAVLQAGEVVRIYERTMSRRGQFENILVLTQKKAFVKEGDVRHWMMLNTDQQSQLKSILEKEPKGLRDKKRENPMWPSAYDAQDIWMSYRIDRKVNLWTNRDYIYPDLDCPLTKFIADINTKLAKSPNQ